jgi:hydrogenase maturation protease
VTERAAPPQSAVLGLGNVLMGDDALGPWVIQHLLARYDFPPQVRVQDLGTPGLDLHPYLVDCEHAVLVDVVRSDGQPGELRRYDRAQILTHPPGPRVSPHDPGVKEALLALEFADQGPGEVLLVGVLPGRVDSDVGLSPPVQEAVETAAAAVLEELARVGHVVTPRAAPGRPDIWWEVPADG